MSKRTIRTAAATQADDAIDYRSLLRDQNKQVRKTQRGHQHELARKVRREAQYN